MEHPIALLISMLGRESFCLGVVQLIAMGCKHLKLAQYELRKKKDQFCRTFHSVVSRRTHAMLCESSFKVMLQGSLETRQAPELQAVVHLVINVLACDAIVV